MASRCIRQVRTLILEACLMCSCARRSMPLCAAWIFLAASSWIVAIMVMQQQKNAANLRCCEFFKLWLVLSLCSTQKQWQLKYPYGFRQTIELLNYYPLLARFLPFLPFLPFNLYWHLGGKKTYGCRDPAVHLTTSQFPRQAFSIILDSASICSFNFTCYIYSNILQPSVTRKGNPWDSVNLQFTHLQFKGALSTCRFPKAGLNRCATGFWLLLLSLPKA